ncbi:MAG: hypothetical protein PHG92_03095 [Patescibacteria group bacterium]|nr:hypothetical protein [Patescibacteria group bacterium]
MNNRKLNQENGKLILLLLCLVMCVLMFAPDFFGEKSETKEIEKPKLITDQKESQNSVPKQKVDPDWYNPRNRIVTVGTLDSLFRKDIIAWQNSPSDSTKAGARLMLRRYVELGSQDLVPLPREPINVEIPQRSIEEKEKALDLQSLRAMLFWRIIFAKESGLLDKELTDNTFLLVSSECPAIVLTGILGDNVSVEEYEEILKYAVGISTGGRFVYECSFILEHHDKLKSLWWYPPMAESAVQTLHQKSPERLLLLKQQVIQIEGGKEALASAEKLLAMR